MRVREIGIRYRCANREYETAKGAINVQLKLQVVCLHTAGGFRLGIEGLDQGFLTIHEWEVVAVPEPSAFVAVGIGLAALALRRRR